MKQHYILLAIVALVFTACARNMEPSEPEGIQVTITASQEGPAGTRTTVQDGGTQVFWEPADEIKVFFKGAGSRFVSQNTTLVSIADFTGTFSGVVGSTEGSVASNLIWGLYPYRADAVSDGESVTTTLPAEQTGRAGSFAKNTNITLAASEGLDLAFYNVCGGLRFSLTQEGIKRVTFEGNNGEAIAGKIKIAFEDGIPVVQEVVNAASRITLTAPNGGTFQTGQWYYISAIPGSLSGGYKMAFYKESESAKRTSSNSVTFKRGVFGSITDADEGLVFSSLDAVDLGLSVSWGSCNVGADFPEEAGGHYQWAGLTDVTSTSIYLDWDNCPYHTGSDNLTGWTKYILSAHSSHWSGEGDPDNKSVLDPEDDIAHVTLGDDWRMPTKEEWAELLDPENCSWVKTQTNGVYGYLVTSKKAGYTDKSIFLPAVGNRDHDAITRRDTGGFYWSSSLYESISRWSWSTVFSGDTLGLYAVGRYGARAVRPVKGNGSVSSGNIQFKDLVAKYACVEKFDSNHDGEVSYAEAAAATSLSGLFTDWNTVTSFDEIKYFTGVTSIDGVFRGLTQLKHITVPDWITTLGSNTFQNCSALDTVALPAALSSIPTYCFDGCSALTNITLPTSITIIPSYCFQNCASLITCILPPTVVSIDKYAFSGCTLLSEMVFPNGFQTIGDYAFQSCKGLLFISIPSTLTSIGQNAFLGCSSLPHLDIGTGVSVGQYAFRNCTSLKTVVLARGVSLGQYAFYSCTALNSIVLPDDMTAIPNNCFNGCTALSSVVWPQALTVIGDGAFYECRFENSNYTLEIPSSVESIGTGAFSCGLAASIGIRHLIIPSPSLVSIEASSFIRDYTYLYVPANMVDVYKVRTNWSNYANRIRPISDYPIMLAVGGTIGQAIDLGLSVNWASWNVGASSPEEYGNLFAWGESETKWDFDWSNYIWCNGSGSSLTKYNSNPSSGAIVDNKTTLDPEDDAASANWGGAWRMPTKTEFQELIDNCTVIYTTENGINGCRFTSNIEGHTDKSIFIPAAGARKTSVVWSSGSYGHYWSSSRNPDYYTSMRAFELWFDSKTVTIQSNSNCVRCAGFSIRPVCDK